MSNRIPRKSTSILFLVLLFILQSCRPNTPVPTHSPDITLTPAKQAGKTETAEAIATRAVDTPQSPIGNGIIEETEFQTKNYPKPIVVRMYLPPGYDPLRPEPYPLLIMLHGQNADGGQWQRLGLTDAADRLIRSGAIVPLVIAMPEEYYTLQYYTDTTYGQVLIDELLPWLQQEYSVCRNRECVAIGGLSRGAAWAARLAFTHWESFGAIGLHSLPTTLPTLPQWVNTIPEDSMPRIYMDIGKQDIGFKEAERFEILLSNLSIPHEWIVQPGEHTEKYWSAHVSEYLRWYNSVWDQ